MEQNGPGVPGRPHYVWLVSVVVAACAVGPQPGAHGSAAATLAQVERIGGFEPRIASIIGAREEAFAWDAASSADGRRLVSEGWRAASEDGFSGLGMRLPPTAEASIEVGISQFERMRVRLALVGAAPSPVTLDRGRAVYADVLLGTDRIFASTATEAEELLLLRNAEAPATFSWRLQLGDGLVRATPSNGGIAFLDRNERTVLRIARPYAVDSHGRVREAALRWDADSHLMQIDVDRRGLAYPVLLDPKFETVAWYAGTLDEHPTHPALAFDAARGSTILFGGKSVTHADTWRWNGLRWDQLNPPLSPPGRVGAAMVYDSAREELVLFGGDAGVALGDTWTWNGSTWTERTPTQSPPPRSYHAMAYDVLNSEVVLFGGMTTGEAPLGDTWRWNGNSWTRATPAASPSARFSHAMAYDTSRSQLLLTAGGYPAAPGSGFSYIVTSDTWRWTGSNWTRMGGSAPSGRYRHAMAYDSARSEVVLFGGQFNSVLSDTWRWTGAGWSRITVGQPPQGRLNHAMTFDLARSELVMVGGAVDQYSSSGSTETWRWNGTAWTSAFMPSRFDHAMVYDPVRSEVVAFGGLNNAGVAQNDLWKWDGATWTNAPATPGPSARSRAAMIFDAARSEAVLFGGSNGATRLSDTWRWNGSAWTDAAPPVAPSARHSHALAYDVARAQTVLFGGSDDSLTPLGDTWIWDGTTWNQPAPDRSPSVRFGHAMVYDATRSRVLLFGGQGQSGTNVGSETWLWDGAGWMQQRSQVVPTGRSGHGLSYDSSYGDVILVGAAQNDTWRWNGSTWSPITPAISPEQQYSRVGLVYDAARQRHVTLASSGATWLLYRQGRQCSTSNDCPNAFCTDGVCCSAARCESCETCAGSTPGRCAPVVNAEDPDTCAESDGKSCSASGDCQTALGLDATRAEDCASGFVVDGVCCDRRCDGPCQACRIERKQSGERSGVCGNAKPALCACTTDAECAQFHHCEAGVCAVDRGAECDGASTLVSASGERIDCGLYSCEGAACKTRCLRRTDCTNDADCTAEGMCVPFARNDGAEASGCRVSHVGSGTALSQAAGLLALVLAERRRRRWVLPRCAAGRKSQSGIARSAASAT